MFTIDGRKKKQGCIDKTHSYLALKKRSKKTNAQFIEFYNAFAS